MVAKRPRIVIVGAGMAGLTAANKLYKSGGSRDLFDLCVVEAGDRIGGRINTSEFAGERIEMGATWIHGIGGSPVHQIATEINSLDSETPWECMDSSVDEAVSIAEGGHRLTPSLVDPITSLFNTLMDLAQGKLIPEASNNNNNNNNPLLHDDVIHGGDSARLSLGSFLRRGLEAYWASSPDRGDAALYGKWSRRQLEEGLFAALENTQRTYTSAGDLFKLDYSAEKEYRMFPGEEITIAKGYTSIVESLAAVLPRGTIRLGQRVCRIEWKPEGEGAFYAAAKPVRLHFADGSIMYADHVIVTVSLGVLKQGIRGELGLFSPPLPSFKAEAISRLGFGVVNKLFLQLISPNCNGEEEQRGKFPSLQMVFHPSELETEDGEIPWWMKRTASISPIHSKSSVLLSWFAGKEALELESLTDEEILSGVTSTLSKFLSIQSSPNGDVRDSGQVSRGDEPVKFGRVLKSQWGTNPLFLGSYSYVAVGASGDDLDAMAEPLPTAPDEAAEPLPMAPDEAASPAPRLQILFAGEATHRTHYSTTHGAYFSGLREANRLLQHYKCVGV